MKAEDIGKPIWRLNRTLKEYIESWILEGRVPDTSMEGIMPDFARVFQKSPDEITFDTYRHNRNIQGWKYREMRFTDTQDKPFFFYVPENWSRIVVQENLGNILEDDVIRQTVFLLTLEEWYNTSSQLFREKPVMAFSYHIIYDLPFLRWTFIMKKPDREEFTVFGVYSSGSRVILIKGPAHNKEELEQQLISLVNTSPWEDWIQNAVKFKN